MSIRNTTRASSRRDGWFNSGDLGRIDADGYLWLTGRAKDVIIRGGHNIDPTVIEETLLKHREVLLAAAVSKPDAYAGELPIAYVQLVPGAKASGRRAARLRPARTSRSAPRRRRRSSSSSEMPLTDVQKPAKVELRRDAARRAFTASAGGRRGAASIAVEMVADPLKGNRAVIRLAGPAGDARREIEDRIHERMKVFAIAYER